MAHTATDKRNALNATTKAEKKIAARIATLPQDTQDRAIDTAVNAQFEKGHTTMTQATTSPNLETETLASFTFHMDQWMAQAGTATAYMDEQARTTRNSEKWDYLDKQAARWHRYANESAAKQNTIGLILFKSGTLTSKQIADTMHNATAKADAQRPAIIAQIRKETKGMKDHASQ